LQNYIFLPIWQDFLRNFGFF